jgi:protein-S-isoprenylcysteine O-methyltransferase Ste14
MSQTFGQVEMTDWFPNIIAVRLFILVFFVWSASEVFNTFGISLSRHTASNLQRDRGSYWIILLIVWGSIIVAFMTRVLNLGIFQNNLQYLGLGLMALGIVLREWAVLSLGRFFTVKVTVEEDQMLVRRGPYHWLRHPAYSGSILTLVGIPLSLGTWMGGMLVLVLSLAGYLYRVRIEEKALLEALGDKYRDYMQHTWRFFPGL